MRRTTLFLISITIFHFIQAQNTNANSDPESKNLIGIYFNLSANRPLILNKHLQDNWFRISKSSALGIDYVRTLSPRLKLDAGIFYLKYKIRIDVPGSSKPLIAPYSETLAIISAPIQIRLYYPKNYFLSFGSFVDFNLPRDRDFPDIDPQSGFGLTLGAGKDFIINNFTLEIIPNMGIHSLIPFRSEENYQRLFEIGLKIGINYKIN